MRILFVTHAFPSSEGDMAGSAVWRLGEGLLNRGHSVMVLAPSFRGDTGNATLGNVPVRRVRYASESSETLACDSALLDRVMSPGGALRMWRMVRSLAEAVSGECRGGGFNIVHAHGLLPAGVAARLADRHGRSFLITLHEADIAFAKRLPGGRFALSATLQRAAAVTAVSGWLAAEAAGMLRLARDRVGVTPMPLAPGRTMDHDATRSGAVFMGNLDRAGGLHDLLDALAMLRTRGRPLELTVIGDGPDRGALKAQAIALGLTVQFNERMAPDQAASILGDRRILVLPVLVPDSGLAVAEALMRGVPVVASRIGAIPEMLADPEGGILVPPGDRQALTTALRTVTGDDRFLAGAWRAGRILADRLSPEKVAEKFESLYQVSRTSRVMATQPANP